jgi:cofilin
LIDYTVLRSPDAANINKKMLFSSSKEALRRNFTSVSVDINATDLGDVSRETGMFLIQF